MNRAELTDVWGIAASRAGQMRAAGLSTVAQVASAAPEEIAAIPGIGMNQAVKIRDSARSLIQDMILPPVEPAEEPVPKKKKKKKPDKKVKDKKDKNKKTKAKKKPSGKDDKKAAKKDTKPKKAKKKKKK